MSKLVLIFCIFSIATTSAFGRGKPRHAYIKFKNVYGQAIDAGIKSPGKFGKETSVDDWAKKVLSNSGDVKKITSKFCQGARPGKYTIEVGRHWKGKDKFPMGKLPVTCGTDKGSDQSEAKVTVKCPSSLSYKASAANGFSATGIRSSLEGHKLNGNQLLCEYEFGAKASRTKSGCVINKTLGEFTCTK